MDIGTVLLLQDTPIYRYRFAKLTANYRYRKYVPTLMISRKLQKVSN
jgi:hypothetical protein